MDKPRILVVDDSHMSATHLAIMLAGMGVDAIVAPPHRSSFPAPPKQHERHQGAKERARRAKLKEAYGE